MLQTSCSATSLPHCPPPPPPPPLPPLAQRPHCCTHPCIGPPSTLAEAPQRRSRASKLEFASGEQLVGLRALAWILPCLVSDFSTAAARSRNATTSAGPKLVSASTRRVPLKEPLTGNPNALKDQKQSGMQRAERHAQGKPGGCCPCWPPAGRSGVGASTAPPPHMQYAAAKIGKHDLTHYSRATTK